jgi:hypothetical protein
MMCRAAIGCYLDKNLNQRSMTLPQTSPSGAESKVGFDAAPIDSVTLSDRRCPEERARTRRYARIKIGYPRRLRALITEVLELERRS